MPVAPPASSIAGISARIVTAIIGTTLPLSEPERFAILHHFEAGDWAIEERADHQGIPWLCVSVGSVDLCVVRLDDLFDLEGEA
jgi:hypothetical protein